MNGRRASPTPTVTPSAVTEGRRSTLPLRHHSRGAFTGKDDGGGDRERGKRPKERARRAAPEGPGDDPGEHHGQRGEAERVRNWRNSSTTQPAARPTSAPCTGPRMTAVATTPMSTRSGTKSGRDAEARQHGRDDERGHDRVCGAQEARASRASSGLRQVSATVSDAVAGQPLRPHARAVAARRAPRHQHRDDIDALEIHGRRDSAGDRPRAAFGDRPRRRVRRWIPGA